MAKIPTIISRGGASGGPTGGNASPSAFGVDISGLARGLNAVSQTAERIGDQKASITAKLLQLDEMRHQNEAETYLRTESSKFLQDPKNLADETSQDRYSEHMSALSKEMVSNAPTRESQLKIENMAGDMSSRGYNHLVANSAGLKASRAAVSIIQNNQASLESGGDDHETRLAQSQAQVDKAFAGEPKAAAALKEQLARDTVLYFARTDPARARAILNASTDVDGATRHTLIKTIESVENIHHATEAAALTDLTKSILVGAMNATKEDTTWNPSIDSQLSEKAFIYAHGKIDGPIIRAAFVKQFSAISLANKQWQKISHLPPNEAVAEANKVLTQMQFPEGNVQREMISSILQQKAGESMQYLNKNGSVAWFMRFDPSVKFLADAKANGTTGWTQKNESQLQDAIIAAQTGTNVGKLGKLHPSLLTDSHARGIVAAINDAKNPDKVLEIMDGLSSEFATPEKMSMVMHDLDQVPETKIAGSYRYLIQNRGQLWDRAYAHAIQNYPAYKKLIDKDPAYAGFENALVAATKAMTAAFGDARPQDASDLLDATRIYATYLMGRSQNPLDAGAAAKEAVNKLALSTMRPVSINGRTFAAPKDLPESADNSWWGVKGSLGNLLERIDIMEVNQSPFERVFSGLGESDRQGVMRKALAEDSYFTMSSDGRSLHLLLDDEGGIPVAVLDNTGKPISVSLKDLRDIDASLNAYKSLSRGAAFMPPGQMLPAPRAFDAYTLQDPQSNFPLN